MTEIATQNSAELSVLGGLAKEAQYYAKNFTNSMFQLGRVLTEAKALVKHGEWKNWIQENAGCSVRQAQLFIQAYTRFGENAAVVQIGECSKIFKLLSLPDGTEEQFLAENDVSDMTAREVEAAVRQVRAEMNAQLEAERSARELAEKKAAGDWGGIPLPDDVQQRLDGQARMLEEKQAEIVRVGKMGSDAIKEANRLRQENAALQQEVAERDEMLAESQEDYNRLQADLLNMQSMAAKGDAERVPVDTLDLNAFAGAVRQFMGLCARVPQMRRRFAMMPMEEKNEWDELLLVIENWSVDARRAINTMEAEGVVLYE